MSRYGLNALSQVLFLPGTFAPGIVALWLTFRSGSEAKKRELIDRLFAWQVPARFYLFAVTYMAAARLTAAALYRVSSGAWPAFGTVPIYLMLFAIVFSTPVQAGEEIGWRGYALPRLAALTGFPVASVILGVIWAVWHLPLFLLANTDSTGQPFLPYLLFVMAISVAITWLYLKSDGSLLLVMLMHAAINNTIGIVPSTQREPTGAFSLTATPLAWLTVIVLWIAAAYFLFALRNSIPTTRGRTAPEAFIRQLRGP